MPGEIGFKVVPEAIMWVHLEQTNSSVLKHLHNVEMRFYRPQAFLSLDFQCRDDVSETK